MSRTASLWTWFSGFLLCYAFFGVYLSRRLSTSAPPQVTGIQFQATLDTLKDLSYAGTTPLLIVPDNSWMTLTFGPEGPSTARGAVMSLKVEPIVEKLGSSWRVTFKDP